MEIRAHPGWNVGGALDNKGSETSSGNPPITRELINALADGGAASVRVPITWWHRMGGAPDFLVREDFTARVRQVVDWAVEAGLYVVINAHHDADWVARITNDPHVIPRFRALWRQIADAFVGYPDNLIFECLNRPYIYEDKSRDSLHYFQQMDHLNCTFVQTVRGAGHPERVLLLPTPGHGTTRPRMAALTETVLRLADPRIAAAVQIHQAGPVDEDIWGRMDEFFFKRGISVVVTEFSIRENDEAYQKYMNDEAESRNTALIRWDDERRFGRSVEPVNAEPAIAEPPTVEPPIAEPPSPPRVPPPEVFPLVSVTRPAVQPAKMSGYAKVAIGVCVAASVTWYLLRRK